MNSLNPLLQGLGRVSVEAAALVVLVLLAQAVFRRKLSPRWRCGLWLLVVGRLLLPVSFGSAVSIFNLAPRWAATRHVEEPPKAPETALLKGAARQELMVPAPLERLEVPQAPHEQRSSDATAPSAPAAVLAEPLYATTVKAPFPWNSVLIGTWLAGVIGLLSYLLISSGRLSRRFARLAPIHDPGLHTILNECLGRVALRKPIQLVECPSISTPALHSLFRPRLLLPRGFGTAFTPQELRLIILHELAHLKRHDLAWNWLAAALQAIYWFNPFVWVAFYCWRADRELACDALALETAGPEQNREYGRTILRLLRDFAYGSAAPGMVGILEDRRQLARRIRLIAGFRPSKRAGLISIAIAAALALVCLTDAQVSGRRNQGDKTLTTAVATNSSSVTLNNANSASETRVGQDPEMPDATNGLRTLMLTVTANGKPVGDAEISAPYMGRWNQPQPKRLTDTEGKYLLRIPLPPQQYRSRMDHFSVSASHPDYAARTIAWTSSGGDVYAAVPASATIKLEKGTTVGGVVKDSRGAPLSGVKVLLHGSAYRGFSMGGAQQQSHEYPEVWSDKTRPTAVTDSSGRWSFAQFPPDLQTVELTFIGPDESVSKFATAPGVNNVNQFIPVSLDDLLARKAVFTLPEGLTVRGIAVDETGKPLPGVLIKEGYGHGNIERVSEFRTGPDGRFERHNRVARQWIYTGSAPERATVSVIAQVEPGMSEERLVLPPAKPLRLRLVDKQGHPASGASLNLETYRNEGMLLDWSDKTDSDGRAIWSNAPTTPICFYANNGQGAFRKFKVRADDQEHVLVLADSSANATVTLKAVDARTRAPLKIKAVYRELNGNLGFKKVAEPDANEYQTTLKEEDWMVGMGTEYKFRVEAEGYEPAITEYTDLTEGDQQLELELQPGGPLSGVALLPNGQPAAGARVWVRPSRDAGSLFCNQPGRYYGERLAKAQVNAEGKFVLPAVTEDPPVVFTHEAGVVEMKLSELKRNPHVQLEPWGKVEGRLLVAGEPKGGVQLGLGTLLWSPDLGLQVIYNTTTDADGKFAFTDVPPGEYKLYRQLSTRMNRSITEDHPMPIVVKAGEVSKVEYGGTGRPVVGQAMTDKPELSVDWLNDDHVLVLKQPPLPPVNREDFATFKAFLEANNNAYKTPARMQQTREARTYVLIFERDGSFRAEDIPPGTYELRIRVTKPGVNTMFPRPEDDMASLTREVVVPTGKGVFDLGMLSVPVRNSEGAVKTAELELPAQTLDGQPIKLKSFLGKPLVLAFWTTWSERSKEQLAALEKLNDGTRSESAYQLLGVCLDSEPAKVKELAKERGYTWEQAFVDKANRAKVTEAFQLDTVPSILLVDAKGRMVGRDLAGDRLQMALQHAIKGE